MSSHKEINVPKELIKLSSEAFENPKRGVEKMYREIYLQLVSKDAAFSKLDRDQQVDKMSFIQIAYTLAKALHRGQKRLDGKRYFDHIQGVTEILVSEFPKLTFNQVIAAYLHDIVEDTDITLGTIENIFGSRIAYIVDAVTKKDDEYYLRPDEKEFYVNLSGSDKKEYLKMKKKSIKQRRTDHYFGHMSDLDAETLQVKFADRLHNLRDLTHCSTAKIKDQIDETETYILPIAYKKNIVAYDLMKIELEKLHKQVYGNTDKFKEYLKDVLGK